jgi:hypothetical protein
MYSGSDTVETVGCPIRKSMDQSLFAAPHGLSQRTTSFIASYRQGIHQMPFCHLIALIINAHQIERDGFDAEFVSLFNINACLFGALPRFALLERGHGNGRQNKHRR